MPKDAIPQRQAQSTRRESVIPNRVSHGKHPEVVRQAPQELGQQTQFSAMEQKEGVEALSKNNKKHRQTERSIVCVQYPFSWQPLQNSKTVRLW